MQVTLHIGAHRTGTTSFQAYLARHHTALQDQGVACWGPKLTRKGLFAGVLPTPGLPNTAAKRARGRVQLRLQRTYWDLGAHTLVVSEENMMGSVCRNWRQRNLYDDVGERLARYIEAFDGHVTRVVMNIRALDSYWASAAAYHVMRGYPVPKRSHFTAVACMSRSWRDVITDVACAASGAEVLVLPFERFVGRPDAVLRTMLGRPVPGDDRPDWSNRRPDIDSLRAALIERGSRPEALRAHDQVWMPFGTEEIAALQETYADDMFWLVSGADGLATLTEDLDRTEAQSPTGSRPRGHQDDIEERRMAQLG